MSFFFNTGCTGSKKIPPLKAVSSACSCFLTSATVTITPVAATSFTTITLPQGTNTAFVTNTVTSTTSSCTSTVTQQSVIGNFNCGVSFSTKPTASSSGSVTCANAAPPGQTNALFRIEANDAEGTLFEGCIASGPKDITTPSGGTHKCDGTNNGANPTPGATLTTQIDAAGMVNAFGYDGTFSNQFDDFFITRISQTSSDAGTQF